MGRMVVRGLAHIRKAQKRTHDDQIILRSDVAKILENFGALAEMAGLKEQLVVVTKDRDMKAAEVERLSQVNTDQELKVASLETRTPSNAPPSDDARI